MKQPKKVATNKNLFWMFSFLKYPQLKSCFECLKYTVMDNHPNKFQIATYNAFIWNVAYLVSLVRKGFKLLEVIAEHSSSKKRHICFRQPSKDFEALFRVRNIFPSEI